DSSLFALPFSSPWIVMVFKPFYSTKKFSYSKRRACLNITGSEQQLLESIRQDARIEVVGLDEAVLVKTLDYTAIPEMHDRQIVATALLAQEAGVDVAILTKDDNITQSGLVPCVW
ncbi:MAG: hypothetical protein WAU10_15690, partial [Caldilineaceae bacterium]